MASGFSQDSIADFLRQRGGAVPSAELLQHFKAAFPQEPHSRAAVRSVFKSCVDSVAFVKTDSGVKHVCLKRQFRYCAASPSPDDQVSRDDAAATAQVQQKSARDSGYGNDCKTVPHIIAAESYQRVKPEQDCGHQDFVGVLDEEASSSAHMGNSGSFRTQRKDFSKEKVGKLAIPQITVIQASPLPVNGSVFILPGPESSAAAADLHTDWTPEGLKEEEQQGPASQQKFLSTKEDSEDKEDERSSLSGSEDSCSPTGSRRHFIQVMMNSSPEVRKSIELRSPVCLTPRSDGDAASVGSGSLDVDRTSVTLDPVEHEWMMCASDAEWDSLHTLLSSEPNLVLKKDFVTGFTCLHWAAKHGKQELIALIINFAKHHNLPISVDVRSNMGYTPLHIAAIHNHMEVLKLLVGAYNADVEIRDYSGRKACHYLTNVSVDIRDIIGANELAESKGAEPQVGGRWRLSKVLQNNLKPIHRLSLGDSDLMGGEDHLRSKPVRRRSSLSRMKPNLQKIRQRASQLVHSTSFRDKQGQDESEEKPSRSRPKTHFLG
ncbi:ankyrin repeat domain-containing protein SOWAHC-like [Poeciliopsis prolifica]|uniref:ankyrin repeat domain-containing protein SOWAHC-like n=1 Tax=Poeciliopsis prolifica TaxID=188132 RepID=UPI0024143F14|nr:ankyrin repeat domain-containing protein SOWAHC-like [Poeciliopsis prolifica]